VRPQRPKGAPRRDPGVVRRRGSPRRQAGRESLLVAAAALFAERGYDAVTTRQILERAGVEAPSLYHHFESKLGLYRAVLAENSEPFVARFAILAERLRKDRPGGVRAALAELVWGMFQGGLRDPETMQIALFEVNRPGPRRYDLIAVWERLRDVFRSTIETAVARGELDLRRASPDLAANLFMGGLTVYAQLHLAGRQRTLTRRLAQQIVDTVIDGLAAVGDRTASPGGSS
jgi:AcrR family transcriptional regulator